MIRIAVIHPDQTRLGDFRRVLAGEADLQVVDCFCKAADANHLLDKRGCDLLLISAALAEPETVAFVENIAQQEQMPPLLVTEVSTDKDAALFWMEAGAGGIVYDDDGWAEIVKKIRAVHDGESLLEPELASALMARIVELHQLTRELDGNVFPEPVATFTELTPREQEVLDLLVQKMSNQDIADTLVIELGTVKNHVHNILRKLDVQNRQQAAQVAEQLKPAQQAVAV